MRRWGVLLIALLVLSLVPAWAIKPASAADTSQVYTTQIEPTDDSYVYENSPDSNYGSKYYMWVGYYNNGYEYGYLKFNLSSVPWYANITSAKVCLYSIKEYNSPSISVHPVVNDDWSESDITWNNKPSYEAPLDSVVIDGTGKYYCWDVTSFVKQQFSGDKVVSLALVPEVQDSAEFYTKDAYSSNPHPYLNVTYTAPPYVPIQEIQSNTTNGDASAYVGQKVVTRGVVTAVAPQGFFMQNGTGPWSGIYVYLGTSPGVNVGDYVEVLGTVKEFYGLTEIGTAMENVTVLGRSEVPEPTPLTTGEVAQEQWESVLVRIFDVNVTDPNLGYGEWEIDDGSGPVRVDDLIYSYSPSEGERLAHVTGVVYYSYGNFKIEPRDENDIGHYVSIQEIQSNTTNGDESAYSGRIVGTEGVVTAVGNDFFIIQNGTGPWSGIFVYTASTPGVSVGDRVRVVGMVAEYYGMTEIARPGMVKIIGSGEVPAPEILKTGDVAQEQWEGVLVQVENVSVTEVSDRYWVVDDGSGPVNVSTYLYSPGDLEVGKVYLYVRGVVIYGWGSFKIMPRGSDDLALKIPEILSVNLFGHYVGEAPINVTIRNNYEITTNLTLKVSANSQEVFVQNESLLGGEVKTISVPWAPTEPGEYLLNVSLLSRDGDLYDSKILDVEVTYGVGISSYELPNVVIVEEPTQLNFTLFNNYSTAKTVNFTVLVNGEAVYSNESLVIGSGEELELRVPWSAPRYGNYTVNATLAYNGVVVSRVGQKIYAQYGISPKGSLEIEAVADAYSYYYKGTDFSWKSYYLYRGTRYELAIGNSSTFSRERAYLRFDLSSIPENANITSAELCVYAFYVRDPMDVAAYEIDDSWSETSNPSEPVLGEVLDTVTMERGGKWYCWNATDYVIGEKSGDGLVSIALKMVDENQDNIAWVASRENPSNKPYLKVNYTLPVEVRNFENVTVVVIGKANASAEGRDVSVKVDGGEYDFKASTPNVFVDARDFDPNEPSLLAYWKAVLTGYEVSKRNYVAEETLEKTVSVTERRLTLHLAMGDPSMAVVVVPKLGDNVKSVTVIKDSGEFKLAENAVSSDLGYYYVTPTHVVVVLKRDPTDVIVTFENVEITTRPPAFDTFYKLSLHYMLYLRLHKDELESEYEKFENFTTELEGYNVDLSTVPVSEIREEMQTYRELTSGLPQNPVNMSTYKFRLYITFVQSRKAFLLHRELMKELTLWNPVLEKAVIKARELAQQQAAQANQTGESSQTMNETEIIIPPVTEEVKVLIDYSHDQYYVGQGIEELTKKIRENLGWEVTVSTEPLTYDLLREYRVVILLNPKEDLSESEIEALQKYVENGGGLFIAGDWYKYVNLESLNAVVGKYGIKFNADELMDDDRNSGRRYYPYVGVYNREHPVMRYVPDTWVIYYSGDTLTLSGDAVWLIRAFDSGYTVDSEGNVIQKKGSGPIVAAAVEAGDGRIVAYGSSRALSDVYYGKYITSNWPFIRGALLWLAHQE